MVDRGSSAVFIMEFGNEFGRVRRGSSGEFGISERHPDTSHSSVGYYDARAWLSLVLIRLNDDFAGREQAIHCPEELPVCNTAVDASK